MNKTFFAIVLIVAACPLQGVAQKARPSPLSPVQLEKLLKWIETKGSNARLNEQVIRALGLGDGTMIALRNAGTFDPRTGKRYTFGFMIGAGRYISTMSDGSSPHVFLLDENLKVLAGLKTGFGIERMPPSEAEAGARETLEQFSQFIEIN